jgi:phosphoribosyl 1,2-cyclic phosphodiesterase
VSLEVAGEDPIVLDLGTGLRFFGETQAQDGSFRGHALITHIHWDHVQGLPFFVPALKPGARIDVHGPPPDGLTLEQAFDQFMRPPFFPVRARDLHGEIAFHDLGEGELAIGSAKVQVKAVPHVGATNGYRIDWDGVAVAYVSDHQSPRDDDGTEGTSVADAVLDLCRDVDVLIHDAQYWRHEWEQKHDWGHCTVGYAVRVAAASGARRLVLFHHDPSHDDDELDRIGRWAEEQAAGTPIEEVIVAVEGMTLSLDR